MVHDRQRAELQRVHALAALSAGRDPIHGGADFGRPLLLPADEQFPAAPFHEQPRRLSSVGREVAQLSSVRDVDVATAGDAPSDHAHSSNNVASASKCPGSEMPTAPVPLKTYFHLPAASGVTYS